MRTLTFQFAHLAIVFLVLIAFKEEFYELIEDGPKPAENEETVAEIEAGEIEEKQK